VENNGKDGAKAMPKNQNSVSKIREAESLSVCQDLPAYMETGRSLFCSHHCPSDQNLEVANPGYILQSCFFTISLTLHFHLHLGSPSDLFPSCSPVILFVKFVSRVCTLGAYTISSYLLLPT
jgi:hypothetical protein